MNVGFFCALLILFLMKFVRHLNLTAGPDLLQALKGEHLSVLDSEQRAP